jgi:hypothetical protein
MAKGRLMTSALAGLLLLASSAVTTAGAVAEPTGCCCMAGTGPEHCSETTEKECLAKQQAAPQYDAKTKYDDAVKKSEAEEAGKMKSGWHAGKCQMMK